MKRALLSMMLMLAAFPLWAQSVYYSSNSSHSSNWATAANELATSLGGSATGFNSSSSANWTPALAAADYILIGQSSGTGSVDGATRTAITDWVSAGGVLLVLRDSPNLVLLNDVLGSSMALGSQGCCNSAYDADKQPAVDGTTFDTAPSVLPALDDFQPINPATLDPSAVAAYVDQYGSVHVMIQALGDGLVGYYSWDWCCGDSAQDRDDWDAALLAGATFVAGEVPPIAHFKVTKVFTDDRTDEVEVTLTCNSGLPLTQSFTIAGGDEDGVTFVITELPEDGANCEITETGGPDNYTPVMNDGAGCAWTGVSSGSRTCEIVNYPDPAEYTVEKDWIVPDAGYEEMDYRVDVMVTCQSDILMVDGTSYSYGSSWTGLLDDGDDVTFVVDTEAGGTSCSAEEYITQSGVEGTASAACDDASLDAGDSATCTFTNTVFFEGIPTLSQYGLALMALLMLGVGFIGFRRFV